MSVRAAGPLDAARRPGMGAGVAGLRAREAREGRRFPAALLGPKARARGFDRAWAASEPVLGATPDYEVRG
jgi:hypothetical protein